MVRRFDTPESASAAGRRLLERWDVKLKVDPNKCQGHAMCHAVSERLFPIDESGYVAIEVEDVAESDVETARTGVDACPERALTLND